MVSVTRIHNLEQVLNKEDAQLWFMQQGLAEHTVNSLTDTVNWLLDQPAQAELLSPIGNDYVRQGLLIVEILLELKMDDDSLIAGLIYPYYASEQLNTTSKNNIKKLLKV